MIRLISIMGCLLLASHFLPSQPVISAVNPDKAPVGATISIKGNGFDPVPASNTVFFGGVRAQVTASTIAELSVIVPAGAAYSPVSVTRNGLTAYSSQPFTTTFSMGSADLSNSFTQQVTYPAGTRPKGICIADFNGDGKPDIVVANYLEYNLFVLTNTSGDGTISFDGPQTYITLSSAIAVVAADFDGDGKLDLAVACSEDNDLAVFRNTSTGGVVSFGPRLSFATGAGPDDLAVADIYGNSTFH